MNHGIMPTSDPARSSGNRSPPTIPPPHGGRRHNPEVGVMGQAGGDRRRPASRYVYCGRAADRGVGAGEPGTEACQRNSEGGVGFLRAGVGPATAQVVEFIDEHREVFGGVEPICGVLRDAGVQIAPSTYYEIKNRPPSARARRDEKLIPLILKIYNENYQVYGARKIWEELHRQGHEVARCTAERLMRRIGIRGVSRGRARRRTTVADRAAAAARPDLVRRGFPPPGPHPPGGGGLPLLP